jgi:nucleotide-binding universal stress UspA family protein
MEFTVPGRFDSSEEENMYRKLLVPLDGSKTAEKALPFARLLAAALKIPVELLEIVDISAMSLHVAADKARYLDVLIAEGENSSREYLKEIAATFPGTDVTCTAERGSPAETIIERAAKDKSTLITMATHGRSGLNRWLMGSVAEKVLRGTGNSLFLVRAGEGERQPAKAGTITSLVVPLDGSALAEAALPVVTEIARLLNLAVVLFRAYELPASAYYGSEDYLPNYDALKKEVELEAQAYLDAQVTGLKTKGLENVAAVLVEGAGADEIIGYAQTHPDSLLVMSTHGRSGVKRWVLGSVTEKVVRHSDDPVLVVHAVS